MMTEKGFESEEKTDTDTRASGCEYMEENTVNAIL